MRREFKSLACLAVAGVLLSGCPGPADSTPTPTGGDSDNPSATCDAEVVDAGAGVSILGFVSLALDPAAVPHVAYGNAGSGVLKYATRAAGAWSAVTVDAETISGSYVSLRIGTDGVAHMSYLHTDGVTPQIRYAAGSGSAWTVETLGAGRDGALVLDAGQHPHVLYVDPTGLYYADKTTGAWAIAQVTTTTSSTAPNGPALALDANGKAHGCYADATGLHYATNQSGTWVVSALGNAGSGVGIGCAIQAHGANRLDLVFGDSGTTALHHAFSTNGVWSYETVDSSLAGYSRASALAVEPDGVLDVVYYDSSAHVLHYATNKSGAWVAQILNSSGDVGWDCALDLTSANGQMHVAYVNRTTAAIDYLLCTR